MISRSQKKKWVSLLLICLVSLYWIVSPARSDTFNDIPATPSNEKGKLSFYFQNIKVRSLLQVIAQNSGLNFIISDAVTGSMTMDLKDVTWQEGLKVIMESQGLGARMMGNVIYISTVEELARNESKKLQSKQDISNLEPLTSRIVQLKYSNATDVANLLKGQQGTLLTARGQVAIDARTNTIIIRDVASTLDDVTKAITKLDVPARQVLIEARIVKIDTDYEQNIGAKFGLSRASHMSGTFAGANQMAQGTTPGSVTPPEQRLNFNTPMATVFGNQTGSIGLAVARLGSVLLDLELSALEGEDHAEVISSPRVITSNQQKAVIQAGEEIPYQEATSSGATSVSFKKAVLSLEIVPQITPDNKIVLKMKASQDQRGAALASMPNGPPAIDTQEVESNIILNNNETVVIGGIYTQDKHKTITRIPFLGSLPIIGYLFRNESSGNKRTELLIFITPKIITPTDNIATTTTATTFKGDK